MCELLAGEDKADASWRRGRLANVTNRIIIGSLAMLVAVLLFRIVPLLVVVEILMVVLFSCNERYPSSF